MSDTPSSPPNKNVEAITGVRQIHKREGGTEFDIEVEALDGKVRLSIKAKDVTGFPGVILNLDTRTAVQLGVSLLAKSEEARGSPPMSDDQDPFGPLSSV